MAARSALLAVVLLLGQAAAQPEAPPLTDEQLSRLRLLLKNTQAKEGEIKAALDAKERELGQLYYEYDLQVRKVTLLEKDIVELHRQKLDNYHKMQAELRAIMGKERFDILRQRLRLAGFFGPVPDPKDTKPPTRDPKDK